MWVYKYRRSLSNSNVGEFQLSSVRVHSWLIILMYHCPLVYNLRQNHEYENNRKFVEAPCKIIFNGQKWSYWSWNKTSSFPDEEMGIKSYLISPSQLQSWDWKTGPLALKGEFFLLHHVPATTAQSQGFSGEHPSSEPQVLGCSHTTARGNFSLAL